MRKYRKETDIWRIKELKKIQSFIQGIDYSKDKVQTSNTNSLDNGLIKIVDLEDEINKDIDKLIEMKNQAREEINKVKGITGTVLEMRYLECMKWEEIAYRLSYSIQAVYKIHGEGLLKIKE